MTVPVQVPRSRHIGNGITTVFAIGFMCLRAEDLQVSVDDIIVDPSLYTAEGFDEGSGGTVTFLLAPADGAVVVIELATVMDREGDYQTAGDLFAMTLNFDFDRIWLAFQQFFLKLGRALTLGIEDIDGQGAYRANGNRISDLGDPVDARDAVPKEWMQEQLAQFATDGTGQVVVEMLADPSSDTLGDAMLAVKQPSAGAVARTQHDKNQDYYTILDFGGVADGVTDNYAAWTAASAAAGPDGVVRFPKRVDGDTEYFFAIMPNLGSSYIDCDEGITLSGSVGLGSDIRVRRSTNLAINAGGVHYDYSLTPEHKKAYSQKSAWITDGDADRSSLLAVDVSTAAGSPIKQLFGTTDTWADATANCTRFADQIQWNSIPADGNAYVTTVRVRPGEEVVAAWPSAGSYRRIALVRTSRAFYAVYADGSKAQPHILQKSLGMAATDIPFDYVGRTLDGYAPENCMWSIRIYNKNSFSVLFNGIEVTDPQPVTGDIYAAGFGIQSLSGAQTLAVDGWAKWRQKSPGGKKGITILCVGDSLTADIHGGWPYALREALDGSLGIRVNKIINQAVSGDNSTGQLALLQANGTQGASHVLICIGTNDIQFSANVATFISNVQAMITLCQAAFATPIVWVPPLWYTQADSGGSGQASINPGGGAQARARLIRLCANMGVKCVDMMQVTGMITPAYLTTVGADPFVRDNIHPTSYGYRIMAYNLARAMAGTYTVPYTRTSAAALDSTRFANGWNGTLQQPFASVSDSGIVTLNGLFSGGTVTNGTVMYTLAPHLSPSFGPCRFLCASNLATPVLVQVDSSGDMKISNASGATFVALDGISFQSGS